MPLVIVFGLSASQIDRKWRARLRFLDAGASSFIGTLWSVSDKTALKFTQNLYKELAAGLSVGEAVREARSRSRQEGDPSWLAYELYGQPNLQVKMGKSN